MKKSTLSSLKFLFYLGGLVGFLILYFLVHNNYQTSIQETNTTIAGLEPRRVQLEEYYAAVPANEAAIAEISTYIDAELEEYPSFVSIEDYITWYLGWGEEIPTDFSALSFSNPSVVNTFSSYVQQDGADVNVDMAAYKYSSTTSGIEISYEQLKDSLNEIYSYEDRTGLDSLAVSYNPATGGVSVNYNISKYFIDYEGAEYEPLPLPSGRFGVDDLFGTLTIVGPQETETETPAP